MDDFFSPNKQRCYGFRSYYIISHNNITGKINFFIYKKDI